MVYLESTRQLSVLQIGVVANRGSVGSELPTLLPTCVYRQHGGLKLRFDNMFDLNETAIAQPLYTS